MNDAELALQALAEATVHGETVTVVLEDGRAYTGRVAEHPTDPELYVIRTGRRGRPATFHPDDVSSVYPE